MASPVLARPRSSVLGGGRSECADVVFVYTLLIYVYVLLTYAIVAAGVDVVSAQMSFSVVDTRPVDGGMTRYCADAGIAVFCHGSLLGGFLTDHWLGLEEPGL